MNENEPARRSDLPVLGTQQTLIICMRIVDVQVAVTNDNCDPTRKPASRTVECNNLPCPPA